MSRRRRRCESDFDLALLWCELVAELFQTIFKVLFAPLRTTNNRPAEVDGADGGADGADSQRPMLATDKSHAAAPLTVGIADP